MDSDRQRFVAAAVAALQTKIAQQTPNQDDDDCGELLGRLEFDYPLLSAAEGQRLLSSRLKVAASADGGGGLQDVSGRHLETARQLLHKAEGAADDDDEGWKGCLCAVLHLGALQRALSLVASEKWHRLDAELRFKLAEAKAIREEEEKESVAAVDELDNRCGIMLKLCAHLGPRVTAARTVEEWDSKACGPAEEYAEESDDDDFEFLPLDQMANSLPGFMGPRTSSGESNNEDFGSQACVLRFQALVKEIEVLAQCFDNLRGTQKAALVRTSLKHEDIKKVGLNLVAYLRQLPAHERCKSGEMNKAELQPLEFTITDSNRFMLIRCVALILAAMMGAEALYHLIPQTRSKPGNVVRSQEIIDSFFLVELAAGLRIHIENAQDEHGERKSKRENASAFLNEIDVQKRRWWTFMDSNLPLLVRCWEVLMEAYKNTKTSTEGLQSCLASWLNAVEGYIDLHLSLSSNEASNKLLQSGIIKITSALMIELHHRRLDFGEDQENTQHKLSLICLRLASSSIQVASYLLRVPKFSACAMARLGATIQRSEDSKNSATPVQIVWALVLNEERLNLNRSGSASTQEDPVRALDSFHSILQDGKKAYFKAQEFLKMTVFDKDQQHKWRQISAELRNCLELLAYIRIAIKSGGGILKTRLWVLGSEEDNLLTSIYLDTKSPKSACQYQGDGKGRQGAESSLKYWSEKIHEYRHEAQNHLLEILKGTKVLQESKGD